MGHCEDPMDGESWRDSEGRYQASVLAFWVGVPSTDLKTPLGSRQEPLGLVIAQDLGCGLSCSAVKRGPWYLHLRQLKLKAVRGAPSSSRSPCLQAGDQTCFSAGCSQRPQPGEAGMGVWAAAWSHTACKT